MTWVVFDYGNVICGPQPAGAVAGLAGAAGCTVAEFGPAYWKYRLAYDLGELDGRGYWQQVGTSLGRSFGGAEVAQLTKLDIQSWMHLDPGTVALVADVAVAGYRLAMLSNAPAEVASAVAALPLAARFEHCLFSCDLRLAKPDQAIFHAVLGRLGARPGDVVFLDDRPENVAGAAAVGIRAVLFTGPAAARAELARLGVTAGEVPRPGQVAGE